MFLQIAEWLESRVGTCTFRELTGMYCPGCGLQRSLVALLKGNPGESIMLYPALLPVLFMFAFLGLHLIFHFRHGASFLKYLFIANVSIIAIHYLVLLIL